MSKNAIIITLPPSAVSSGYTSDYMAGITAIGGWYVPVITGLLSLMTVTAILAFTIKKI